MDFSSCLYFLGCDSPTSLKIKDIVKVYDTYYEKISNVVSFNELLLELDEIKLTTPKTNGKYEFINYEASRLKASTKIYKLNNDEYIAEEIVNSDKVYQKYRKTLPDDIIEE